MDNEKLFNIIGKLYIDLINSQNIIELLHKKLQEKDKQILEIESKLSNDRTW